LARTAAGAELTRLHRQRQLALRAATLRDLLAVWPAFDIDDIDGSWPALEAALVTLVNARHRDSSGLAAAYYRTFRQAEGVPGRFTPKLAEPPNPTLLRATLNILGPIATKKAIARGQRKPAEVMLTRLSGSVSRQVLDGSRRTLQESTKADPRAQGWRRITSGNACSFCAAIAAEGVIGSEVDFAAHDHCSCTQEVAY
jgi:hypothetical protein